MKRLGESIWIFEGDTVQFFSMPYSTRMTIVKLASGGLWVHSPIKLTQSITQQLHELGPVEHLIAPNHLHHLFLKEWTEAFPEAQVFGTDEVIKKRPDIHFDGSFNTPQQWPWSSDIETELFTGSTMMEECVFFHRLSHTLIVTDLIENFSAHHFKPWQRVIAGWVGILAPNGKMPLDWRLSFLFSKKQSRKHLEKILSWQPKIIVMAHGEIVQEQASDFLDRSFKWLK
ncbi:DUF4336 domain-containing protein [Marinomonas fungiae]|uniref:DUF4336 domain-containing protein n=1 Tax=Marinomonas fungiae TaxID=1137284 RepID=UPI003A8D44E7